MCKSHSRSKNIHRLKNSLSPVEMFENKIDDGILRPFGFGREFFLYRLKSKKKKIPCAQLFLFSLGTNDLILADRQNEVIKPQLWWDDDRINVLKTKSMHENALEIEMPSFLNFFDLFVRRKKQNYGLILFNYGNIHFER